MLTLVLEGQVGSDHTELELVGEQSVAEAGVDHRERRLSEGLEANAGLEVGDLFDPNLAAEPRHVRRDIEAEIGAVLEADVDLVQARLLLLGTNRVDLCLLLLVEGL